MSVGFLRKRPCCCTWVLALATLDGGTQLFYLCRVAQGSTVIVTITGTFLRKISPMSHSLIVLVVKCNYFHTKNTFLGFRRPNDY